MNLEEIYNQKYDMLTANDREMLHKILREKGAVREMNSTQLASFLHVSRTTLARLMKKLEIDSYTEFKLLLDRREETGQQTFFDMQLVVNNYHQVIDALKKHNYEPVCRAIYRAKTVYLYGTGNEQKAIAEEFKRIFLILGKCCVDLFDFGEMMFSRERFHESDLLIAISLSGESQEAARIVRAARETGIGTLSLTRWDNNTLARLCRDNLYVGTKTVRQAHFQSYEMVAAFYILLDILSVQYLEYAGRQKGENADADRRTSE